MASKAPSSSSSTVAPYTSLQTLSPVFSRAVSPASKTLSLQIPSRQEGALSSTPSSY